MRGKMKRTFYVLGALLLAPTLVNAQGTSITAQIGGYVPAGSFQELQAAAEERKREATMGLGLAIDFGGLRASLAYATGAKITEDGVSGEDEIGEGSVLAATGAFVLRPLPRLIVLQPYLLAGAGVKNLNYKIDSGVSGTFPEDERDLTLHLGVGADIMLGRIGISAEISDFLSQNDMEKWKVHDAFAFVGLKLRF